MTASLVVHSINLRRQRQGRVWGEGSQPMNLRRRGTANWGNGAATVAVSEGDLREGDLGEARGGAC